VKKQNKRTGMGRVVRWNRELRALPTALAVRVGTRRAGSSLEVAVTECSHAVQFFTFSDEFDP